MVGVIMIVGCSRGFGKALVEAALDNSVIVKRDSDTIFILITTSKEKTREMWNEVYERKRGRHFADDVNSRIQVLVEEANLCSHEDLNRLGEIVRLMFLHAHTRIDEFYLFLNAGSVTPVGAIMDSSIHEFEKQLMDHCMLNFVSFVMMTRAVIRLVLSHKPENEALKLRVVNVSSLAAVQPLYGMGVYCAIKAARESIMQNLALELETEYPENDFRVLNYAPGPMATKLVQEDLLGRSAPSNYVKDSNFSQFIDTFESAKKCLRLLTDDSLTWKNGGHVDFFDPI